MSSEINTIMIVMGLPAILGGMFATMLWDDSKKSLMASCTPFFIGVLIGVTLIGVGAYNNDIENKQQLLIIEKQQKNILTEFENLDCKSMGDFILSNYMDGNRTITSKAIPIFKDHGCKFDVATQTILGRSS